VDKRRRTSPRAARARLLAENAENARALAELERNNLELRETQARLVQSAKMSAIGQLAAGISHEIRNPLNVIAGSIYVLRELLKAEPNPKVHEYLDHVEGEVKRATALIDGLLEFARPAESPLDSVDLNAVVARSLPLVTKLVEKASIELRFEPARSLPRVLANAGQLQQVVVNVLLNAAQAIDKPNGSIRVRTRAREGTVRIEVEDTGRGIAEEDMERLFEPFFTRREGGTGLGLYVSYGIVQRHGGRIEVFSRPGVGTTVSIVLPEELEPARDLRAAPAGLSVQSFSEGGPGTGTEQRSPEVCGRVGGS